jgi:hypothetical protein
VLARLLLSHLGGGQLAKLIVDKWQQLLGRLAIAVFDLPQDARDVAHGRPAFFRVKRCALYAATGASKSSGLELRGQNPLAAYRSNSGLRTSRPMLRA